MNAFIFAFRSDKAIHEYLNTEEPIPDDNDFIPEIHPASVPVDSNIQILLNGPDQNENNENQIDTIVQKNIVDKSNDNTLPLKGEILPQRTKMRIKEEVLSTNYLDLWKQVQ